MTGEKEKASFLKRVQVQEGSWAVVLRELRGALNAGVWKVIMKQGDTKGLFALT